jgi:hypothetical protein
MEWIDLAQESERWCTFVKAVVKFKKKLDLLFG